MLSRTSTIQNILVLALLVASVATEASGLQGGPLPVLYFHGMGSSCELETDDGFIPFLQNNPNQNPVHCVEYSAGPETIFTSMTHQGQSACSIVTKNAEKWSLKNGFTLVGLSQGALAARYVLQECPIGQYAVRLITAGGPHNGVVRLPQTTFKGIWKFLNDCTDEVVYLKEVQNHIGPAGYFKSLREYKHYLQRSNFLRDANNELEFNLQYKNRMAQLDKLVLIRFTEDTMVNPSYSAQFGYFKDATETEIVEMRDTEAYKNDILGLKTLDQQSKIQLVDIKGNHLQITHSQVSQYIIANFAQVKVSKTKEESHTDSHNKYSTIIQFFE